MSRPSHKGRALLCPRRCPGGGSGLGRKVATRRWGACKAGCHGWGEQPPPARLGRDSAHSSLLRVFRQAAISSPGAGRLQVQTNAERQREGAAAVPQN